MIGNGKKLSIYCNNLPPAKERNIKVNGRISMFFLLFIYFAIFTKGDNFYNYLFAALNYPKVLKYWDT